MFSNFHVEAKDIRHIGFDLQRPESVKTKRDGSVWVCDARGFVRIDPNGEQVLVGDPSYTGYSDEQDANVRMSDGLLPTGFTFSESGDIIFAAYGERRVCRMSPQGEVSTFLQEVEGVELTRPNFVMRDKLNRYWIVVSTKVFDWSKKMVASLAEVLTGFVVLVDVKGARIVAEGLHFANECRIDNEGVYFYIAETFGTYISRFRIAADGSLTDKEQFGPAFEGPIDGIAFDQAGNLWVTQPLVERIVVLPSKGEPSVIADFSNAEQLANYQAAMAAGKPDFNTAARCASEQFGFPTSIAFGGDDLKTVYVGSLLSNRIASFQSPVAGVPAVFW
jgi:gluconolactonase